LAKQTHNELASPLRAALPGRPHPKPEMIRLNYFPVIIPAPGLRAPTRHSVLSDAVVDRRLPRTYRRVLASRW